MVYDEGSKEVKVLKSRENQSKEIKNLPVSAVFLGSQDNLLYDEVIKNKFKVEFTSKLARRSFFVFSNESLGEDNYETVEELIKTERDIENKAISNRNAVYGFVETLTNDLLPHVNETISVSEEVINLFTLYKKYNEYQSNTMDNQYPISKLTRAHLQWKALKLSGAFAIMECSNIIELSHYRAAIEFVELTYNDVAIFEKELVKEPYELFTDYVKTYAINGEYNIGLHNLRKLGFIPMKGQSSTQLKELVKLATSYDSFGTYILENNNSITFKEIKKTNNILLSYLLCTGTKQQRAIKCNIGFQCEELEFKDLENMLKGDYAYSPFKFNNGIRGKDNIISGCKWIVLDVDTSEITDKEAHMLLSDINHYIVRTSNKNNNNKYRVLIELDAEVDIPDTKWKSFIGAIANDLGIVADGLPKSQIFFSYSDRDILSTLDAEPLYVKPYLDFISSMDIAPKKSITKKTGKLMLDDPFSTFDKAFNARDGEGRRKLIWACRYARELGADRDYCKNLITQITEYWVKGFPEEDLQAIFRQLDRWSFE